jgi:hypothetical protein
MRGADLAARVRKIREQLGSDFDSQFVAQVPPLVMEMARTT